MNTRGKPVKVDDLISKYPPNDAKGTSINRLRKLLLENGLKTEVKSKANIDYLVRHTNAGKPVIATIRTGPNTFHAVVVDGVTKRGGQKVVAIRDPAGGVNGGVYYETVKSFETRWKGGGRTIIRPVN